MCRGLSPDAARPVRGPKQELAHDRLAQLMPHVGLEVLRAGRITEESMGTRSCSSTTRWILVASFWRELLGPEQELTQRYSSQDFVVVQAA